MNFIIYSLPRSRTAWLSHFLTYKDVTCFHEEIRHLRTIEDVKTQLNMPNSGSVETCAAPWWRMINKFNPKIKTIVIKRPIEEIVESFLKTGIKFNLGVLYSTLCKCEAKLDQIAKRVEGAKVYSYSSLSDPSICAEIFEYCTGYEFDYARWWKLSEVNIQINLEGLYKYSNAFGMQLNKLANQAKQHSLTDFTLKQTSEPSGITFALETFEDFYKDGKNLFKEHLVQVGETSENYSNKNLPLLQKLDELGCMQIVTARSNGRMFGYLMSIISPSLENETTTCAAQTTFFADKSFPGLGLKLQRFSVQALKERGINEIYFRTPHRGPSEEKMEVLYKRLGASNFGKLFQLNLKD